jgi:hypothetical protein
MIFGCPKRRVVEVKIYPARQFLPGGTGRWLVQGRFYPYGERFLVGMVAAKHLLSGRVLLAGRWLAEASGFSESESIWQITIK